MKKIILALTVAIILSPTFVFAEKTHIATTYPILGRGVRPLGMGNAFLTMKGSDQNAIFYNPAAIRDYPNDIKWTTSLPLPGFEFNYSSITLVKDVFNFKDDLDDANTDSAKIDVFRDFLNKHVGEFHNLEIHMPIVGAYNRYFSVGLINEDKLGISFRNRSFPNFEIKSGNMAGLALGSAYGFFNETLEIGAAVKVLYGVENEQIITTSDILINNMDDFKWGNWKRGMGVGADVGVKYEIPDFGVDFIDTLKPTVAVTYQNIGKTRFSFMKKNGGPESLPQSVSAGIGVHPVFGAIETSILVDIREINIKEDFLMKLNAGAEVRFPERLGLKPSLRAGTNQGYLAVGGGLEVWKLTWNVAFFGKEVGEVTREKGGYRIANELVWRF